MAGSAACATSGITDSEGRAAKESIRKSETKRVFMRVTYNHSWRREVAERAGLLLQAM